MLMKVHTDVNITFLSTRGFLFNLYDQKQDKLLFYVYQLFLNGKSCYFMNVPMS